MNQSEDLQALATAAGLRVDWVDASGQPRRVAAPTLCSVLEALGYPARDPAQCRDSLSQLQSCSTAPPLLTVQTGSALPVICTAPAQWCDEHGNGHDAVRDAAGSVLAPQHPGYWTLLHGSHAQAVAVAPAQCYRVSDACGSAPARAWGLSLQAYSARSKHDGGIGDAAGADAWVNRAAQAGADALALSPLHAARPALPPPHDPYSPYSPSDRRFLDPVHAAPHLILGELVDTLLARAPELATDLQRLQAAELIDWPAASHGKWRWLRTLHAGFVQAAPALHEDLLAFTQEGGASLAEYARFAASDFADADPDLHIFGQWLAARSWQHVQRQARARGMAIGLIADLAVGFDPHGAEAAAWPLAVLKGIGLGAPPDAFNNDGQAWNLGAYSPAALRATGYAPYLALLRAAMRDRGGLRIDHILGLQRLWLVPEGAGAGDGVYLDYPLQDLLNLLALESWRQRVVVIGEDLGVVPPGIRQQLSARAVMGIDVLMFTRNGEGGFLPPAQWRADAVATTTTHDLPTLVGWRQGVDLGWRQQLGLGPVSTDAAAQRDADVATLGQAIAQAGLDSGEPWRDALGFAAAGPAPLALLPVEDALALPQQPNLPGTVSGHPNWCRRLPEPLPANILHTALEAFAHARRQ